MKVVKLVMIALGILGNLMVAAAAGLLAVVALAIKPDRARAGLSA